jgi:hypothetical protein
LRAARIDSANVGVLRGSWNVTEGGELEMSAARSAARGTLTVRVPTASPTEKASAPTFELGRAVNGLKVGLRTDQAWRSWSRIAALWEELLEKEGAQPWTVETMAYIGDEGSEDRRNIAAWADEIDCGIVGLGTCGSCTSYSVADAVTVERREKPVIVVVTSEFETHARNMASFLGHGGIKVLVLPYPLEARPDEELDEIAASYFPAALELLGAIG